MDEQHGTTTSSGDPDELGVTPAGDTDAHERLANTAAQEQRTSLAGTPAARSADEIVEGLERAQQQPGYGREGS